MTNRRHRKVQSIAATTAEIALAAPQVIAHRVARMAMSGPVLSARDRKEFHLMGAEKMAAMAESWNAMVLQSMRANQALAAGFIAAFWSPSAMRQSPARAAAQLHGAALGVLAKGMAPVHRKATANARRLARTKLR
jgi:hypothetical protein